MYKLLSLFVCLFVCQLLFSQNKLTTLRVVDENNKQILQKRIKISNVDKFSNNLYKKYHKGNFLEFSIDSVLKKQGGGVVKVFKGCKYKIETIDFNFESDVKLKQIKSIKKLYCLEDKIINNYNEQGYLNAQFTNDFAVVQGDFKSLNISCFLNKGECFYFDSVKYKSSLVNFCYLSKLLQIIPKKAANKELLNNLPSKVSRSKFLFLDSAQTRSINNKIEVELFLKEQKHNSFSGILGFYESEKKRLETTGNIQLSIINELKYGESLNFIWRKSKPQSQQVSVEAKWPFVFSNVGLELGLKIHKEDTLYTNTTLEGGFFISNIAKGDVAFLLNYESSSVGFNSDSTYYVPSELLLYGFSYCFDELNNYINPTKGLLFESKTYVGRKINNNYADKAYKGVVSKSLLRAVKPVSLFYGNFFFDFSIGTVWDRYLSKNQEFVLGGISNFRGFAENTITAKSYTLLKTDYRFNLNRSSYAFLFYDFGYTSERQNKTYEFINRQATGIGVSISTKAGFIKVAYALGRKGENKINLKLGKVHMGYVSTF